MPDPTIPTAAVVQLAAAAGGAASVTLLGVPLGLRVDLLIAGFAGSVVAMALFNSVPGNWDTWQQLVRSSLQRIAVAVASSLVAGYVTPILLLIINMPLALVVGTGFVVGAGARQVLTFVIQRVSGGAPMPASVAQPADGGTNP
ncbi:hypothetical protein [Rhodoferax sp. TS-BS-61-7]|uniref:hypothetical protein n=1 Tax=Rhodoferax sp. TS-BS-61-7 TaxID=2094194 RepID=UPI00191BFC50|nr:hypothetical protein [Rhodoferax sp. TS-BS-61-7]